MTDHIKSGAPGSGVSQAPAAGGPQGGGFDEQELERLHVLRNVALASVRSLLRRCPLTVLEPGQTLLEAGQTNRVMFMLLSGKLSVHLESGKQSPIASLEAGQTVGELSVIDGAPASAWVLAETPSRLLCVDESVFWKMVSASPEFATNLLLLLARRMRASNTTLSESERLKRHFETEARVDGLTGLHNRRWLDETMPRLVNRHARDNEPFCVCIMDIDHFKRFNDEHGHTVGDEVLVHVARSLTNNLRPTDMVGRYGGEEFVAVLPRTALEGGFAAAERLREAVSRSSHTLSDGWELPPVTISLGLAELAAGETPTELLGRADQALYRAKGEGRNRTCRARSPLPTPIVTERLDSHK